MFLGSFDPEFGNLLILLSGFTLAICHCIICWEVLWMKLLKHKSWSTVQHRVGNKITHQINEQVYDSTDGQVYDLVWEQIYIQVLTKIRDELDEAT